MNINNKLKRNISVSYIYNFLLQLNITSAIWVLYLAFRGMSLVEIGLLESVYHITGVLFELPTGVIADVYGKKFSVVTGRIVSVVSCILMITSDSFLGFAIAFCLSSASMNLNSGAAEALVYDSLCFSAFMICVFPLFGLLAEKIGFSITFGIIGLLYIPVMMFLMLKLRKHKNKEN